MVVGAGWVCWLFSGTVQSAGVAGLSDGVRLLSLDDSLAADSTHTQIIYCFNSVTDIHTTGRRY